MLIDFDRITETSKLGLLSGRDNGVAARKLFHVANGDITPDTRVKIKDNDSVVVSNSYFLGLLEDIFKIHKSKEDLLEHIDYTELSKTNQKELLRGVNRGFSPIINAMG
ncbi:hypothetical protein [Thalassolituus maritimus]|uniref:hypothetical protein n=1 Tax=Thalassolituus maritimus TaxID=484498 RepID=UPI00334050F2